MEFAFGLRLVKVSDMVLTPKGLRRSVGMYE